MVMVVMTAADCLGEVLKIRQLSTCGCVCEVRRQLSELLCPCCVSAGRIGFGGACQIRCDL